MQLCLYFSWDHFSTLTQLDDFCVKKLYLMQPLEAPNGAILFVQHNHGTTFKQVKAAFISFKDVSSYAFWSSAKIDYLTEMFFKISHRFNNNPSCCLNLLYFGIKWQKEATCWFLLWWYKLYEHDSSKYFITPLWSPDIALQPSILVNVFIIKKPLNFTENCFSISSSEFQKIKKTIFHFSRLSDMNNKRLVLPICAISRFA